MTADYWVSFPGLGIKDIPINRIAFNVFGLPIYWYGLLIAAALIICLLLAMRQASANKLTADDVMDTFIAIIPLAIVFARLYYVVFQWNYYAKDWKLIFDTRHGGLAFYGGVIGGALAILLVTRIKKIKISLLLDFLAVYLPLGQAIGRWGNFFNQEAFGTNTTLPWGMYSNGTADYLKTIGVGDPAQPVHPTFLYEFIANMVIFAILLRIRKRGKFPLATTLWYLLMYGVVRFFVEGIRTDALLIPGSSVRISQLLSALMVIVAGIVLIILNSRKKKQELNAALLAAMATVPSPEQPGDDQAAFVELDSQQDSEPSQEPAEPAEPSQEPAEPAEPSQEPAEPAAPAELPEPDDHPDE